MFTPKEVLPKESCPPPEAEPLSGVYARLLDTEEVDPRCFYSFNKLGKFMKPYFDPCVWAACSLVEYDESWPGGAMEKVIDFARSARLLKHKTHVALVTIGPNDGVGKKSTESPHVSFWMDHSFNPEMAVSMVVPLL